MSSVIYADPQVMHRLVRKYSYVKYPEAEVLDINDVKKLRDEENKLKIKNEKQ